MAILALNVGSSSLKAALFNRKLKLLQEAEVRGIHNDFHKAYSHLMRKMNVGSLFGIGHRFVHGGWKYERSAKITPKVLKDLEDLAEFAPLHNPECLAVIKASRKLFPNAPQIAIFDTAFHRTLPPPAATYGIPRRAREKFHIHRYGFHGISHAYLASKIRRPKLITLHLGNGCSAAAILNGVSIDTSMGFSPAEGLLMGTRAGDIDFSILEYLSKVEGKSLKQITHMLNFESGLLGVSGKTSDVKTLLEYYPQDPDCRLAIDLFCYRIAKIVGAYTAVLNGVDAIVFSGGIGENSAQIRQIVCAKLGWLGLKISSKKQTGAIHTPASSVEVHVVKTDENLFIAKEVLSVVNHHPHA